MSTPVFGRFAPISTYFQVFPTFQPRYLRPLPQPALQLFGYLDLSGLKHSRLFSVYNVACQGAVFYCALTWPHPLGGGRLLAKGLWITKISTNWLICSCVMRNK